MNSKNYSLIIAILVVTIGLSGCAPASYERPEAGFFSGIWHGLIFVFSIIGKVFGADIGIYAENNTGFTYWLGFIIGLGGFGGGSYTSKRQY
jgi:hypothetical protein